MLNKFSHASIMVIGVGSDIKQATPILQNLVKSSKFEAVNTEFFTIASKTDSK